MLQDYEYDSNITFQELSDYFLVPLSEIYKANNIPNPYPVATSTIKSSEFMTGLDGIIKVPMIQNGNESAENDGLDSTRTYGSPYAATTSGISAGYEIGWASQNKCWIEIQGSRYAFPCFPENYSDTHSAHFTTQHPMGRSEPFQIYQNSGPRVVSVSFTMHVEMTHSTPIRDLVAAVQSAEYPLGNNRSSTIVPKVILKLGDSCYIEGIIADNVTADWSGTIIDNRYTMVTLSFSVTECTGLPRTANMVLGKWAR